MKKTLIALMALAGIASAATEVIVPIKGNFYADDYSFSFTLGESMVNTGITNDVIFAYGNDLGGGTTGTVYDCSTNAYMLNGTSGSITMSVGCGTLSNYSGSLSDATTFVPCSYNGYAPANRLAQFYAVDENGTATTTAYTLAAGTYTIDVVGADGKQLASLYLGEDLVAVAGRLTDGSITLGYSGNMTATPDPLVVGDPIKTAFNETYAAIPEPTTATLSLLALAGLAARRRRK